MKRSAALVAVAGLAAATVLAPAARAADGSTVDRTIRDQRIEESSGLSVSPLHPGVLWTHNDSGNRPRLYAVDPRGRTAATLTLKAEPNVDWEAIAAVRGPAGSRLGGQDTGGRSLLAVGDIGDNNGGRENVRVALVREPDRLTDTDASPAGVLRLRYPGGPRDAEALLADPRDGRLYLVSKTLLGAELYAVPVKLWPRSTSTSRVSKVTTLVKVATFSDASLVTDGAFLPDGRMLLRGYGTLWMLDRPETAKDGRIAVLSRTSLPEQEQGESLAVTDDGRSVLVGSEGRRSEVVRVPVPAVAGESDPEASTSAGGPDPTGDSSGTADTRGARIADAEPTTRLTGLGGPGTWLLVIGGGILLVVLVIGGTIAGTRRIR